MDEIWRWKPCQSLTIGPCSAGNKTTALRENSVNIWEGYLGDFSFQEPKTQSVCFDVHLLLGFGVVLYLPPHNIPGTQEVLKCLKI